MNAVKIKVAEWLCSDWIGKGLSWVFSDRIPFYRTKILTHHPEVKNKTKALLFWRLYESSEVRFVNKYLSSSYDVIELGGSIGAVSIQIGKKIGNRKLVSVEPDPFLLAIQHENLMYNGLSSFVQINAAYGSVKDKVWFAPGEENLLGKIGEKGKDKGFFVGTVSLKTIIDTYHLSDYALVCDIEGAEIDLLLNEEEALTKCRLMIIETHETIYKARRYKPEEMKALLMQRGFTLIDQHGVNLVLMNEKVTA